MTDERAVAWDELLAALPRHLVCGQPSYHDERPKWVLYCYDPTERPKVALREREWQAVADSEVGVMREIDGPLPAPDCGGAGAK